MVPRNSSMLSVPRRFEPDALRAFATAAFCSAGATSDDAEIATEVLLRTDLRGVHSHGLRTLKIHLETLRQGGTRSPAEPEIVRETPVTAVVDGHGGLGLVVASFATDIAIQKAKKAGIGIVLVRGSNHFGAAGHYALQVASAGFIGAVSSNASPIMTAAGSRRKAISNAPFAYAIPTETNPLSLDIAMSATAGMKVRRAAATGEQIPFGWVVDSHGDPTTDPQAYLAGGSLLPMAGHKGYGLAVFTEIITGALSGAAMLSAVPPWLVKTDTQTNVGHAIMAIDIECFMERSEFYGRVNAVISELHNAPTVPGVARVMLPGELEIAHEADAHAYGLPLDDDIVDDLLDAASDDTVRALLNAARLDSH
jgi:ureidoglycolate dehydrogenase (NAD+)